MASIIQWNCNSLNLDKQNELKLLENKYKPFAFVIQETKFRFGFIPSAKGFTAYYQNVKTENLPKWGVMTLVRESFQSREIKLNTKFNAIAVEINFPRKFTLCNIYWSNSEKRTETELRDLIAQLGENFLILGDLNANNQIWGSNSTNGRGTIIEKIIDEKDLIILNTGSQTHLHFSLKTFSAIDLSLCSMNLSHFFSWEVENDLHQSDHFPIVLKLPSEKKTIRNLQKFQVKKANWESFRVNLNVSALTPQNFLSLNAQEIEFTNFLINAARKSIPMTTGNLAPRFVPWWNDEISDMIAKRKKALNNFRQRGINADHAKYMQLSRNCRKIIREAKQKSWELFVSGINNDTTARLYSKVRALSGKNRQKSEFSLSVGDNIVTNPQIVTEIFAQNFENTSKIASYEGDFIKKIASLNEVTPFESDEVEPFNISFTINELEAALKTCSGSTPGADKIHYAMMKNMSYDTKLIYLNLVNRIWSSRDFPKNWKKTIAIPIPKGNKDQTKPENYRPIQLENVPSKVMQKMVAKRLTWTLDIKHMISDDQSGFRKKRCTLDAVTKIVNCIQEGIRNKKYIVTLHFDVEKAYDTVWRRNILEKLKENQIGGNMFYYIKNFMEERTFQTIVNGHFSEEKNLETGLVQGAVLSVPLFLIGMESISKGVESLSDKITKVSFADDLTIGVEGENLEEIEDLAQEVIDWVEGNAKNVGFKISQEKTKYMIFAGKKKINYNIHLELNGSQIERVESIELLGITLDEKITWNEHIKKVEKRAKKRLNILRMLKHKNFGAKRNILLNLNKSIVLSALDYGAELYHSANKKATNRLNSILNAGIRIATGAFKTSPTVSVLREANCLSLDMRRRGQRARFAIRVRHNSENPLNYKSSIRRRAKQKKTICEELEESLIDLKANVSVVEDVKEAIPRWMMKKITINLRLSDTKKSLQSNKKLKTDALFELQKYSNFAKIYTDGSKIEERVGYGVWSTEKEANGRLKNHSSIFTAEMYAIQKAIRIIETSNGANFLIVSDSLSCLRALENFDSKDTLTNEVKQMIAKTTKNVEFLWVPSHVGIQGNEKADELAKNGTQKRIEKAWLTKNDALKLIKNNLYENYENEWKNTERNNKLREIMKLRKNVIEQNLLYKKFTRKDSRILTRLKIGHTKLTHEYLLKKEHEETKCNCGEIITVRHILDNCNLFTTIRNKHKVKFKNLRSKDKEKLADILNFLKEIDLYEKI